MTYSRHTPGRRTSSATAIGLAKSISPRSVIHRTTRHPCLPANADRLRRLRDLHVLAATFISCRPDVDRSTTQISARPAQHQSVDFFKSHPSLEGLVQLT